MPNLPISGLPAVTTPLSGAELLALVQGGVTSRGTAQNILSAGLDATFGDVASKSQSFNNTTVAGLKFNNLTSAQVSALTPADGNSWYNSTLGALQYYNGSVNKTLLTSADLLYSTVGTGGDYPTLADAFSDGKYNLIIISDITETADYTFNQGGDIVVVIVNLAEFIVSCGIFSPFTRDNQTNVDFFMERARFNYSYTSNKSLFGETGTGGFANIILNNAQIQNNSTASISYMVDMGANGAVIQAVNCGFIFNDGSNGGFNLTDGFINNSSLYGGGTNCNRAIMDLSGIGIIGCSVQGSWSAPNPVNPQFIFTNGSVAELFVVGVDILIEAVNNNISQVGLIGGGSCSIVLDGQVNLATSDLGAAGKIYPKESSVSMISNCKISEIDESLLTTTADLQLSNCIISNSLSLGAITNPIYNFCNSRLLGGASISCDAVKINNCFISTLGGGGTITINASANKTILIGNTTDAAIVNNGTNTELVSNTTY